MEMIDRVICLDKIKHDSGAESVRVNSMLSNERMSPCTFKSTFARAAIHVTPAMIS
jgi:hypothetical protein